MSAVSMNYLNVVAASLYADLFGWAAIDIGFAHRPGKGMNQRQLRKRAAQGGTVRQECKLKQRRA